MAFGLAFNTRQSILQCDVLNIAQIILRLYLYKSWWYHPCRRNIYPVRS